MCRNYLYKSKTQLSVLIVQKKIIYILNIFFQLNSILLLSIFF